MNLSTDLPWIRARETSPPTSITSTPYKEPEENFSLLSMFLSHSLGFLSLYPLVREVDEEDERREGRPRILAPTTPAWWAIPLLILL